MIINWYGEGCFRIQTGGVSFIIDLFSAGGGSASGGESSIGNGLVPARGKNEVTLKTLTGWPIKDEEVEGQLIRGAGEYEIQKILVSGFPLPAESTDKFFKTVYKVTVEDMALGFLGHLSEGLSPAAAEKMNDLDILFIPAGGKPFIDQEAAAKLIKQLNPKLVVASFFKIPGLKRGGDDWKGLADEMDQKPEVLDKLTIRKKELAEQKGTKLVVLKI